MIRSLLFREPFLRGEEDEDGGATSEVGEALVEAGLLAGGSVVGE